MTELLTSSLIAIVFKVDIFSCPTLKCSIFSTSSAVWPLTSSSLLSSEEKFYFDVTSPWQQKVFIPSTPFLSASKEFSSVWLFVCGSGWMFSSVGWLSIDPGRTVEDLTNGTKLMEAGFSVSSPSLWSKLLVLLNFPRGRSSRLFRDPGIELSNLGLQRN